MTDRWMMYLVAFSPVLLVLAVGALEWIKVRQQRRINAHRLAHFNALIALGRRPTPPAEPNKEQGNG